MRVLAVTNMYPTPSRPALGTFVEQQIHGLRRIGVDVDVMIVDRVKKGPTVYLGVPHAIRDRLKRFDADVVHVMYGGVMADVATRTVRDRPTVVTFHGTDLLGEQLSGPWRRLSARYGVLSSWKTARRVGGVVVVANKLSEALPRDIDRAKVRVIPCGIDTTRFAPMDQWACRDQLGWSGPGMRVLFNSNGGDPVKRPGLAYEAVEKLKRKGVDAQMCELRGLSNAEMPLRLNAGDVLLLTSLHEGSPTIVKEALACNLPVVSVDVGDVRNQVQGIHGCHIASADSTDLAAKLQLVHAGPRRVQARSRMEALSLERMAVRLKEFYEELASMTPPIRVTA